MCGSPLPLGARGGGGFSLPHPLNVGSPPPPPPPSPRPSVQGGFQLAIPPQCGLTTPSLPPQKILMIVSMAVVGLMLVVSYVRILHTVVGVAHRG